MRRSLPSMRAFNGSLEVARLVARRFGKSLNYLSLVFYMSSACKLISLNQSIEVSKIPFIPTSSKSLKFILFSQQDPFDGRYSSG